MRIHTTTFRFGPFSLDLTHARLMQGAEVVKLRPKSFRLLCHLEEHPGCPIGVDELLEKFWSKPYMSGGKARNAGADVIKGCIREIRKALGDHAAAPRYIETVPRLGYRFVHPVTKSPQTETPAGKRMVLGQSAEVEKAALLSQLSKLKASLLPS